MLISNKRIIDLKILSKTEASHRLQKSEVCSKQGAGLWHTGKTPADAGCRDQKVPQSKRSRSPLEGPFPSPHCPCIPAPQISSPRQVLSLSSGESILESFNCLGHHRGNFCEEKQGTCFIPVATQTPTMVVSSQSQTKSYCSWLCTTRQKYKPEVSSNTAIKATDSC